MSAWEDGCSNWPDLWFKACCDAHDLSFATDTVDWSSHIDLGICVIQTAPEGLGLVAVVLGVLMAGATTIWWRIKHVWFKRDR